jgi:hypothetical protein
MGEGIAGRERGDHLVATIVKCQQATLPLADRRRLGQVSRDVRSDLAIHPSSIGVRFAALTRILCVSRIVPVRISTAPATLFATMDGLLRVRFRLTLDFFAFVLRDFAMYFPPAAGPSLINRGSLFLQDASRRPVEESGSHLQAIPQGNNCHHAVVDRHPEEDAHDR